MNDEGAADRAELRAIVAALAPTEPGSITGSATAGGPRAERLLTPSALTWAAQLSGELADNLLAQHPGLTAPVAGIAEQIQALMLRILLRLVDADGVNDAPEMTGATDQSIRELIAINVPFARVAESVRLAHESVVRALLGVAIARGACAATLTSITLAVNRSMDEALDNMADHYQLEAHRFSTSARRAQQELIDKLIGGNPVDARMIRKVLAMSIDEHHQGFVISTAARSTHLLDRHTLRRPVEAIKHALKVSKVLVREHEGALWVWATSPRPLRVDVAHLAREIGDAVRVGVGSGQARADGFRRTHLEAAAAHRLRHATLAGVIEYDRHALAILLSADREKARWFVESELGELAMPSPRNCELLTTLRCYFASKLRIASTSERLHIHRNTAIQRLNSIETILGHPVTERMAEVQCALTILDLVNGGNEESTRP